jgi:hypothetical protein
MGHAEARVNGKTGMNCRDNKESMPSSEKMTRPDDFKNICFQILCQVKYLNL